MILDGHIHIGDRTEERDGFLNALRSAGVDGGLVISLPPPGFPTFGPSSPPLERMDNLLSWCATDNLYPFFWVDPIAPDAADQVAMAVDKGAMGFKVICDRFFPQDDRAMTIFTAIADANLPILFHSGILWDGKPSSSYNRPAAFEALLTVKGLRFSLAHISWPWCDELIAVYGKFLHAHAPDRDSSVEMFIDTCPGTPPIYRPDALTKLFTVGYDVASNVVFGTDFVTHDYSALSCQQLIERDMNIFKEIGLDKDTLDAIYAGNLKRFLGI